MRDVAQRNCNACQKTIKEGYSGDIFVFAITERFAKWDRGTQAAADLLARLDHPHAGCARLLHHVGSPRTVRECHDEVRLSLQHLRIANRPGGGAVLQPVSRERPDRHSFVDRPLSHECVSARRGVMDDDFVARVSAGAMQPGTRDFRSTGGGQMVLLIVDIASTWTNRNRSGHVQLEYLRDPLAFRLMVRSFCVETPLVVFAD